MPTTASAFTTDTTTITPGVVGYGTVTVPGASSCTSAQSNPGATSGNVNGGTESDCAAISSYTDTCASDGNGGTICHITLGENAPTGWSFDHWSGGCTGTSTSCTMTTSSTTCDYSGLKPQCDTQYAGDIGAVAHFVDTRAPTSSFVQAPGNNSAVYSDTGSQQFTFHTDEDGENPTFQCKKDAGSYASCSSGITWSSISDGVHDFCVHGTDASGLLGGAACVHWEQETNPTVAIQTKPSSISTSGSASFTYTSNKASHPADGSTLAYRCSLDNAALATCPASGDSFSNLSDGSHTFKVEADFHGALESFNTVHTVQTPYAWTVDKTPPQVSFTDGPADGSTFGPNTTQTWTFADSDSGAGVASVVCSVDGTPIACAGPTTVSVANAGGGAHTVAVTVTDGAGHQTTVSRSWTIDATGPVVSIDSGPADGSSSAATGYTWTFSANEPATFKCRVYPAALTPPAFADCSSATLHTASGFSPGTYTFEVVGTDSYGTVGASVKRTFTVVAGDRSGVSSVTGTGTPSDTGTSSGSGTSTGSGAGAGLARVAAKLSRKFKISRLGATVTKLRLSGVTDGAAVTLACKGHGCAFRSKRMTPKKGSATLERLFKKKTLAPGSVITIVVGRSGMKSLTLKLSVQKKGQPRLQIT